MANIPRKSSLSSGKRRNSLNCAPRFVESEIAGGKVSTAKHHAFDSPQILESHPPTDYPGSLIPGPFPENGDSEKRQRTSKNTQGRRSPSRNWDSLPTHERPSGSRVGVGSLPGPNDEAGVALLPDERPYDMKTDRRATMKVDLPTHETPTGAREGVGSLPGPNAESGVAILPDERHPDRRDKESEPGSTELPSSEHPSGSRVGIGSMPGKNTESGVATLPEERIDGRPYGHGHTGFEKTLGNQMVHTTNSTQASPHEASHPSQPKLRSVQSTPSAVQANSHPPETIFSATQRAKQRDMTSVASIGAPCEERSIASTFVHGAGEVLEGAEHVASNICHGAQHIFHDVGQYFGGTKPQSRATDDMDRSDPIYPTMPSRTHLAATFATAGPDAPNSKPLPQSPRLHPPTPSSKEDLARIVGTPATLPRTLQSEYLKYAGLAEYDLDGERLDMDQFIYPDDSSVEGNIPPMRVGVKGRRDASIERNRHQDSRGEYNSSNGRCLGTQRVEEREIAVGADGVQFYFDGKNGILPGYPTPEGMQKLMSDRMKDDLCRLGSAQNVISSSSSSVNIEGHSGRAQLMRTESGINHEAVRGSSSELPSASSGYPDPTVNNRILEEKREILTFVGGGFTPDGKYEAVVKPAADEPEELAGNPVFQNQKGDTAAGRFEATFNLFKPEYESSSSANQPRRGRSVETKDYSEHGEGDLALSGPFDEQVTISDRTQPATKSMNNPTSKKSSSVPIHTGGHSAPGHRDSHRQEVDELSAFKGKGKADSITSAHQMSSFRTSDEQVVTTNHLNDLDERPGFMDQKGDNPASKSEATFKPTGIPNKSKPQTQSQSSRFANEAATTNHPEINEVLIVTDGSSAAEGKFEAICEPVTGQAQEIKEKPEFKLQKGDTAARKFGATFEPEAIGGGAPARYLGKPVDKKDANVGAQYSSGRMGVN